MAINKEFINYEEDLPEDIEQKEELIKKSVDEAEGAPIENFEPVGKILNDKYKKNTVANNKSVGALWQKLSKAGRVYFIGKIIIGNQTYPLVAFYNNKTKESQPDLVIKLAEDKNKV